MGRYLYYGYLIFRNRVVLFLLGAIIAVGIFWLLLALPWDFLGVQRTFARQAPAPAVSTGGSFTGSTLQRSTIVNKVIDKSGIAFQVNSFEQYADGFSLTYSISSVSAEVGPMVLQPELIQVTDSDGRVYTESLNASGLTVGPGLSRGYITFTPAFAGTDGKFKVQVPHMMILGPRTSDQPKVIEGPWEVDVQL